jgi:plasmid stabilization system protein ParE
MRTLRIRLDPRARQEYIDDLVYIGARSRERARIVRLAIRAGFRVLRTNPAEFKAVLGTRCHAYEVRGFGYTLYYLRDDVEVLIVAIASDRRKEWYWLERLEERLSAPEIARRVRRRR